MPVFARGGSPVVWGLVAANLFMAAMYQGSNHRQGPPDGSSVNRSGATTLSQPEQHREPPPPVEKRAGCELDHPLRAFIPIADPCHTLVLSTPDKNTPPAATPGGHHRNFFNLLSPTLRR